MSASSVMHGFPPAAQDQVTLDNWRDPPFNRWAFHNVNQIIPCAMVWNACDRRAVWASRRVDITELEFTWGGETMSVNEMLARTCSDGFVVVRGGEVVHESYAAGLQPHLPHILFSVTKSITALLCGVLVEQGRVLPDRGIVSYIPELADSGYADATVRDLLDMTVGIAFEEDYEADEGDMIRYREATGWNSGSNRSLGLRRFLATLAQAGPHGEVFKYCSPNTDLLGWVLERAGNRSFAALLEEHIWQPMQAEQPACVAVDAYGAARTAGGLCTTTRDLARVGQLVLQQGRFDGRQIVPEAWIRDIFEGGSREQWRAGSFAADMPDDWYRSQWYKHGDRVTSVSGLGIYGQSIHVDTAHEVVIAKHSSQPRPLDFELEGMQRAAFAAIAGGL